ncbi:MAG TPA: hypothetical protein VKU62_00545 [Thermoanaerobaculia bacterium]|nr:hypothetical protein [Thermoanaerobaculia bacterium]
MKHIIRIAIAIISILIGIAGVLLPILPGWPFFAAALLLIFPEAPIARKALAKIESRWPRAHRILRFLIDE